MARHDDRNRILAIGGADRASLLRIAETFRKLTIARRRAVRDGAQKLPDAALERCASRVERQIERRGRKSTRLNSSHSQISYAVFCLKKKRESVGVRSLL